jgi:hypothetical protein
MADLLDVLTLREAQQSLDRARDDQSTLLESLITSVSRKIDSFVGPVVQRTVTAEKHSGGCSFVLLHRRPALTITTVVENGTTLTSGDYDLEPDTGQLFRTTSADGHVSVWAGGRRRVVVTYEAGRYATTNVVDDVFKDAARITLANLWRMHQDGTIQVDEFDVPRNPFPSFGLPNAAKDLLAGERLAPMAR